MLLYIVFFACIFTEKIVLLYNVFVYSIYLGFMKINQWIFYSLFLGLISCQSQEHTFTVHCTGLGAYEGDTVYLWRYGADRMTGDRDYGKAPLDFAIIRNGEVSFSGKEIIPLLFPMQKHLDYRERLRGELLQPIRDCLHAGKRVAMVTLGDVSIYSTAAYVQQVLEADGYATEVVAGISAFSAGAAKAKCSLCERQESLLVLPGGAAPETIQQALEQFDTLVLMKAGKALPWLVPLLQERQLLEHTTMLQNIGMEGEWIGTPTAEPTSYFTTLIIRHPRNK